METNFKNILLLFPPHILKEVNRLVDDGVGSVNIRKVIMDRYRGNLKIPGHEDAVQNVKRFVVDNSETSKSNAEIAKLYDAGLKWNTHVYCVPEKLVSNVTTGLTVTDCSAYGGGTAAK